MRRLMLLVYLMAAATLDARPSNSASARDPDQQATIKDDVFEVATLKRNHSAERGGGIRQLPGGRVAVTNMPARQLIIFAYGLGQWQLIGGPGWLANDKFDLTAKMEGNPEWAGAGTGRPDPIAIAMQKLLADRFKLRVHTEMRDVDAYALVLAKPGVIGPALKPSPTDCRALMEQARQGKLTPALQQPVNGITPCRIIWRIGQLSLDGFPMAQAATSFVGQTGRPVVDRTELAGNWQFLMSFAEERPVNPLPEANIPLGDPNMPSFFTALQEQLGLKLASTKAPFDVTIIDSAEHPTDD
jgi:bla regulator protein blaR1